MSEIVEPDPEVVEAYWAAFAEATGTTERHVDVFAFGDSAEMADELADLALAGTKRATAGDVRELLDKGVELRAGDLSVVHRGDGTPVAVVRTTEARVGPLSSVDDAFAWDEGEGDRTRDGWVAGHQAFFRRWFAAQGRPPEEDPVLLFERFEVVWPAEAADA